MGTRNPVAGLDKVLQNMKIVGFSHIWHSDNFGTTYLFLQLLKLATSNLAHNLGSMNSILKQLSELNLAGVWAWGASEKFWDPLIIFAAVEASVFKFGT